MENKETLKEKIARSKAKITQTLKVAGVDVEVKGLGRTSAVRIYCWECSGYNTAEITKCVIPTCPLYYFRMKGSIPLILTETFSKIVNE